MANNIYNYSDNTVVSGSSGNDYIPSWGSNVKIYSAAGNDSICTFSMSLIPSNYVTIVGGKGNDSIDISRSSYNKIQYANGDGNDTIVGYGTGDTIQITSGTYTKSTVGNDVVISVGNGKMTLKNAKNKTIKITGEPQVVASGIGSSIAGWISGGVSGRRIDNTVKSSQVNGSEGNDIINNQAGGVKIYAGSGNDSISSSIFSPYKLSIGDGYITIDGGAGNDTIRAINPRVSINGGSGNDSIVSDFTRYGNVSNEVTIAGGTGNDTIISHSAYKGNIFQYAKGDGNDVIYGYNSIDRYITN